jgi:Nif-specific regulatory protein
MRKGRFELADGGTLFLDEIGEISTAFQAKLLRVLQESEFERVGGTVTQKVNVRLVTATNKKLEEAVTRWEFRADLYYRINVVPIFLPPLRERPDDIPLLAREFLRRFNQEHESRLEFAPDALSVLRSCLFPGNVRELENCVRRTATLAPGEAIAAKDFACRHDECMSAMIWKHQTAPQGGTSAPASLRPTGGVAAALVPDDAADPFDAPLGPRDENGEKSERERLIQAMEAAGWVQAKAARLLGITSRQIGYALRKHAVTIRKF